MERETGRLYPDDPTGSGGDDGQRYQHDFLGHRGMGVYTP